jgi:hypothetical protein
MRDRLEKAFNAIVNKDEAIAESMFKEFVESKKKEIRAQLNFGPFEPNTYQLVEDAINEIESNPDVPDEYRDLTWFETKDWFYAQLPSGQLAISKSGNDYVVTDDPVMDFPKEYIKDDYLEAIFNKKDQLTEVKEDIDVNTVTVDVTGYGDDLDWVDQEKEQVNFSKENNSLTEMDKLTNMFEWHDNGDMAFTMVSPKHFYIKSNSLKDVVEVFVEDDEQIFNASQEELNEMFDEAVDKGQLPNFSNEQVTEEKDEEDEFDELSKEFLKINQEETDTEQADYKE